MINQLALRGLYCSAVGIMCRLFQELKKDYGEEKAFDLSQIMNHRAPLTIRVNPVLTSREKLLRQWKKHGVVPTDYSPYGIKFVQKKHFNLLELPEFEKGFFEIQDEASQLAALQVRCQPGDIVLDYCSGSGGKTLAIAHQMQGKGQIFMHDPRETALDKARKRANRAGIQNVQYHHQEDKLERTLKGKVDWLLLDMPCTGTGTLRRNPDIKMKFDTEWLKWHIAQQESIMKKALKYVNPRGGKIVYMTCSLLKEENEEQLKKFIKNYGVKVEGKILRLMPEDQGMDGFFAATLTL